ncbi:cytidine deaminase [Kaistia sp. 32K]|uniref:cytidine deaminase n=1 Tax=Kaistia sp. 32K TaxID=2795690 RepID=UPI0019167749|nr:cytidine deaminase [Kaistia sp. 32K]BCP51918.1 cytidine deaminase [Kaistia sp. 32K]
MNSPDRFRPDAAIGLRCEALLETVEPALNAEVAARLAEPRPPEDGLVLSADVAAELVARHNLADIRELMLLLVPFARNVARPPISNFTIGAVALERETGALLLGGNVEFPGANLGEAIHGEQFLSARAFSRGTSIAAIALEAAPPCGHCRQFLAEFRGGLDVDIITMQGHRIPLRDLLPWAFSPADLGEAGVTPLAPGSVRQSLAVVRSEIAEIPALEQALVAAGQFAYVPYGRAPSAVALRLVDGSVITGAALENVAFNPSLGPLQVALVNLIAAGRAYDEIELAVLGGVEKGAVDYSRDLPNLLATVAPKASFKRVVWEVA